MKKVLSLIAAAGLIAASTAAFGATIVGSKHDLSSTGSASMSGSGSSTQICVYCHAPHNASSNKPLWNRNNPSGGGFTLYSGLNMQNVSFKTGFTSDSTSLFCMSCHDGSTQIDAVYNAGAIDGAATTTQKTHNVVPGVFAVGNINPSGPYGLGTNLSSTHPINFPVSLVGETDGQKDLWVGSAASMGKTGYEMPLFKAVGHADPNRQTPNRSLECGSCHAVHDSQYSPFLRYTMEGSKLCLGCHNK